MLDSWPESGGGGPGRATVGGRVAGGERSVQWVAVGEAAGMGALEMAPWVREEHWQRVDGTARPIEKLKPNGTFVS